MLCEDFNGISNVTSEINLNRRLRYTRKGQYGTFILSHSDDGSSLLIHINGDIAYLHFFPSTDEKHPGFQAIGIAPPGCTQAVHFLQIDGSEGSSFDMIPEALVPVEKAYQASREYFQQDERPMSISWLEL
jgi:hypothetical protein